MVNKLPKRTFVLEDREYEGEEKPLLFTRPKILGCAPIPIPLHGQNPRTIKGREWWDAERKKAYAVNNYHCFACGVWIHKAVIHPWLEAHEVYKVNDRTGKVALKEVVALCHSCHNFIHMGRILKLLEIGKIDAKVAKEIIVHGLFQVSTHKVGITREQLETAEAIVGDTLNYTQYKIKAPYYYTLQWNLWYLWFEGKKYYSLFKNETEWRQYYDKLNNQNKEENK
jgi:hypothetical protein